MESFDLYSLRHTFDSQGIMICFNGLFSHTVIEELGEAAKKHLQSEEAPRNRIKDVFSVFIEQAQNLKHYTTREDIPPEADKSERSGTLVIARQDESYIVGSGNFVLNEDVSTLRERLEPIVAANKEELKQMYKKRLREPIQEGAGAGLGFISMARKASKPLNYSIRNQSDRTSFFTIEVII